MAGIIRRTINLPASATVITGVSGKKIRVLSLFLVVNGGSSVWKFQSAPQSATGPDEEFGGPTDLTGNMYIAAGTGETGAIVLPYNPEGWFETRESDDLDADLVSGTSGLGGAIVAQMVDA